jgi:hypothetical protein
MKTHLLFVFTLQLMLVFSSSNAVAFEYFDNFERYVMGSDFSSEYNKITSAENAVIFSGGVRVKLVNYNIDASGNEMVPDSPRNPKVENSNPSESRVGDCINCAIQFTYPGSSDLQADAWSEQRFMINPKFLPAAQKGLTEIWLQYDQYIPKNYHHRDPNPAYLSEYTAGDKVLSLFGDSYSDPYPTYVIERQYKRKVAEGEDLIPDASYVRSTFYSTDATATRRYYESVGDIPRRMIIDPRIEKGHWQRRTLHLKLPISASSNDGIIEFWVQRLADTASPITEKLIDISSGNFYDPIRPYINAGYLMGWSNNGYNENVTYLIDNLILSDDIKSIDSSAIYANTLPNYPPDSPSDFTIE